MTTTPPSDPATTASNIAADIETITNDLATAAETITKATAWTALVGFFTALPGIVALIRDFMGWVNAVSGNNPQSMISDLGQVFSKLSNAKSEADHAKAAQDLAAIIKRLPPR